ncbi:MAG TPA: carboxypeptidase-like regulatory domain-containing protein [Thermoanaerobaculia bacterium]|nr:carboxypeptidase-like regulatory domain-containing protein [Thermoanaerobaculia bacterium]
MHSLTSISTSIATGDFPKMTGRTKTDRQAVGSGLQHRLCLFFLLVVFCVGANAAPLAGGSLDITVHSTVPGHDPVPVHGVYMALVRLDQPAHRPSVEAMVDGDTKWEGIAAGRYVVLAEAPSFYPAVRSVEIADGRSGQVTIELHPQVELIGTVVDGAGRPVKGATVRTPRIVPPFLLGNLSHLARQHAGHMSTTTDENGWWKLEVPIKGSSMLVEAPGYEAAWVIWDPAKGPLPPTTLQRGSSLRVLTNRPVPELILTLVPTTRIETSIPADWQDRVWGREAETTAIEWKSQPAGEYDLVASWPEPGRFTSPVILRHVTLSRNDSKEIRITLPDIPPLASKNVRVLVPWETATQGLHAFIRTANGAKEVPAASEIVFGGRVLYADADVPPEDVFFTNGGEVILGVKRGHIEENEEQAPAVAGIKFPKADGTLKVSISEPAPLPSHGNARFDECQGDMSYVLPVNVRKNGDVALPLLVGCRALLLRFESFSPVVIRAAPRPRELVWLGAHRLKAAASAQIHVIHKSDGTNAAEALVTAFVNRGPGDLIVAAKQVAGGNGWLVMEGLPVGEEITFRAEDSTKLAGTVTRTLDPGKREVIDPLPLPESGSLTVIPRFGDDFKNNNADAEITDVIALGENGGKPDSRSAELTRDHQEAVFPGLNPGSWRILVDVKLSGLLQQVDVTTLTIEPGDKKKLEPVIKPLVVSGLLTSHGHGVKASISFTDPPGPGATVRRVMSKEGGGISHNATASRLLRRRGTPFAVGSGHRACSDSTRRDIPEYRNRVARGLAVRPRVFRRQTCRRCPDHRLHALRHS